MVWTRQFLAAVLAVGLLGSPSLAGAEVFKCLDADGKAAFQDRPCAKKAPGAPQVDKAKAQQTGKHFLWKAQSGGATVYLLGSVHFGKPDMYPLAPVITSAFEQSKVLVVEANVLDVDPMAMAQKMASIGMYTDGTTLHDAISAQTWQNLEQAAGKLGIHVAFLEPQKPWFVAVTLETLALMQAGYDEKLGIDLHFLTLAHASGKKIVELESMDAQLDLFNQLTPKEQEEMLREMLSEYGSDPEYFGKMLAAWREGDIQGMDRLINEELDSSAESAHLKKLLFTDRNAAMLRKIQELARQGGIYFIAVGAGHMVGNDGLVTQLRARGFQVQQM